MDLGVADKLANGTVAYVLAVVCVVLAAVVGYLFVALQKSQNERHAETVEVLTAVVALNVKTNEGLDVLDKAVDVFTEEKRT